MWIIIKYSSHLYSTNIWIGNQRDKCRNLNTAFQGEKKKQFKKHWEKKALDGAASDDILWAIDLDLQLWWPISISSILVTWMVQWLGPWENFAFDTDPLHALPCSRIISLLTLNLANFSYESLTCSEMMSPVHKCIFIVLRCLIDHLCQDCLWFVCWSD